MVQLPCDGNVAFRKSVVHARSTDARRGIPEPSMRTARLDRRLRKIPLSPCTHARARNFFSLAPSPSPRTSCTVRFPPLSSRVGPAGRGGKRKEDKKKKKKTNDTTRIAAGAFFPRTEHGHWRAAVDDGKKINKRAPCTVVGEGKKINTMNACRKKKISFRTHARTLFVRPCRKKGRTSRPAPSPQRMLHARRRTVRSGHGNGKCPAQKYLLLDRKRGCAAVLVARTTVNYVSCCDCVRLKISNFFCPGRACRCILCILVYVVSH